MDKKSIEAKLKKGIFKTEEKPSTSKSSAIWTRFKLIVDENGATIPNVIACDKCKLVYNYESHKMGTSNILKHKCASTESQTLQKYFTSAESYTITEYAKKIY